MGITHKFLIGGMGAGLSIWFGWLFKMPTFVAVEYVVPACALFVTVVAVVAVVDLAYKFVVTK